MAVINNNLTVRQPSNKHMGITHTNNKDTKMTQTKDKHMATTYTNRKVTLVTRTRMVTTTHRLLLHLPSRIHHSSKAIGTMQTSKAMTAPHPSRKIHRNSNMKIQRKIRMEGSVSVAWLIGLRPKEMDLVLLVPSICRVEVGAFRVALQYWKGDAIIDDFR
jgi:hypothetical protein